MRTNSEGERSEMRPWRHRIGKTRQLAQDEVMYPIVPSPGYRVALSRIRSLSEVIGRIDGDPFDLQTLDHSTTDDAIEFEIH